MAASRQLRSRPACQRPALLLLTVTAGVPLLVLGSGRTWAQPPRQQAVAEASLVARDSAGSSSQAAALPTSAPPLSSSVGNSPRGGFASWLASAAAAAAVAVGIVLAAPQGANAKDVDIYFGAGNFYHLQHEFVMKEALDLSRREADITAVTGYAGGKRTGDLERVCYSGFAGAPDHVALGHAQVVRVTLPEDKIVEFTDLYMDTVVKRRLIEKGTQFRPVIGLRGGLKSAFLPKIEEATSKQHVELVKGDGDDPDMFGQSPLRVYVYDTKAFPFRPAELGNQFRDDLPDRFPFDYRELGDKLKKIGAISATGCPG